MNRPRPRRQVVPPDVQEAWDAAEWAREAVRVARRCPTTDSYSTTDRVEAIIDIARQARLMEWVAYVRLALWTRRIAQARSAGHALAHES